MATDFSVLESTHSGWKVEFHPTEKVLEPNIKHISKLSKEKENCGGAFA